MSGRPTITAAIIAQMAEGYSDEQIVLILNRLRLRTGTGLTWRADRVRSYRQYHKLGVEVLFHSFYNARQKPGSIHPKIMPPTAQARAATNAMFLSDNNSSAPRSWQSLFITPDGLVSQRLPLDKPGVMVNIVDTSKRYYDASRPYRLDCINGKWNSGEAVNDARSKDRQSY